MKITDEIIQKFWGEGRGFVVAGLTRWGGFVQDEDLLDDVYFTSLTSAISARDRGKEFETELHMINYMMRLCYWAWCEASERRMNRSFIISESRLYPTDSDSDFKPRIIEPSEEQPDLNSKSVYLTEFAAKLIKSKYGDDAVAVYRLCILGDTKLKDAANLIGITISKVGAYIRVINILLRKRLESHAREYGLIGRLSYK